MNSRIAFRLLIAAGAIILGLVIFRERQQAAWQNSAVVESGPARELAPRFELADHHKHFVKFERYLGRQPVVLVFFDATLGAGRDPRVQRLLECFDKVHQAGIEVVAVSDATPYANREVEKEIEKEFGHKFPFPLLTDIDTRTPASHPVHRQWGVYDEATERSKTGVFLIARDGRVRIGPDFLPAPVEDEQAALAALCAGHWPE